MTTLMKASQVIEEISIPGFEKVLKVRDKLSGLQAIICIHDLRLGPALGGTRIYPYPTFEAALNDVLRLAEGMTYKSAVAGCSWGGGKSVIIASPEQKTENLLISFGQVVTSLKGMYICAEDLGCTQDDMLAISKGTPYVVGIPQEKSSGNPSPFTAWGTFRGIQAALQFLENNASVAGKTIAIQGVGSVGERLAEILFWHGAKLILTDLNREKAEKLAKLYGGRFVPSQEIFSVECDVFSPCAMGGIINSENIQKLRCKAIAGSANNQLLQDYHANEVMKKGILYAPDFVINSGGLINVTNETFEHGYDPKNSRNQVDHIYDQLMLIFDIARKNKSSTHEAAINLGNYRLEYGIGRRMEPVYMHHANLRF